MIRFNSLETRDFGLPDTMSPGEAVATAQTYENLANWLLDGSLSIDTSTVHGWVTRARYQASANRYGGMAAKIFDLCPVEHLELLALREAES